MIHIKESIELIHIKENISTMIHIKENIEVHVVQVGNWMALYVILNVLVDSLESVQFVGEDSIHMVEELEQSHGHLANYRRKVLSVRSVPIVSCWLRRETSLTSWWST